MTQLVKPSKNWIVCLGSIFIAGFTQAVSAQEITRLVDQDRPKYVAGEVLVSFHPAVTIQAQNKLVTTLGARKHATIGKAGIAHLKLPQGTSVTQAVAALRQDVNVAHVQPNYLYHIAAVPNDLNYGQLWGLKNDGLLISNEAYGTNNPGTTGLDIDAELAWDQITNCGWDDSGDAVIVAVLDTGINYSHTDLLANMWDGSGAGFPNHGWDFIDGDNDPMPTGGLEDHGTHVAGTIGAVGNNSSGTTGVCWQAHIMSVRVLGADGSGNTAGIIQGIEWASANGADVINMSFGRVGPLDPAFSDAIDYAQAADVVIVVAAGNNSADNDGTPFWPCNFTQANLICVAALDQAYELASFSNYGTTSVDVGAPGTNVLSTYAGPVIYYDIGDGYTWTLNGDWTRLDIAESCVFLDGTSIETLVNPANYCNPPATNTYATGPLNDTAYRTFNLSGVSAAAVGYIAMSDTEPAADFFRTNYNSAGGDPFTGGINVNELSGSSGGSVYYEHDLSGCLTANCTIGFQLETDGDAVVDLGVSIALFEVGTLVPNTYVTNVINGTSQASPHVAGIAIMVRAYNPDYTYTDVVNAIRNGGETAAALSGNTTTGNAANAMGALAYINPPDGVSVTYP